MFFVNVHTPVRDIPSLRVYGLADVNTRIGDVRLLGGDLMARRTSLPSTPARIFARKPSRGARILSALLLSLSLLATLAGIGTAIYLERAREASVAPTPALAGETPSAAAPILPAAMVATSDTHDPSAASAAVRAESPDRQGTSSPPIARPPQTALLEVAPQSAARATALPSPDATTAAEPRDAAPAATQYWVEYGVFNGARAAKRLQQALADQGLDTVIVPTHAPDGRPLLRVRSSLLLDHGTAKAASENARRALKLSTLLHRSAAPPAEAVASAAAPRASQGYWVQFGAFPHHQQAARLQEQLARSGVETAVSPMRATSGRLLYRVRSLTLPDRDSALAVASRGREAGNTEFLVGQSIARPAAAAEPTRTQDDSANDSTRYHAADSLPFPAR
jgi:cell division protein FtsN